MESIFPMPKRLIAIGDIHGDIEKLIVALINYGVISPTLDWVVEPKDTYIVQVGDQVDSALRNEQVTDMSWEKGVDIEVVQFLEGLDQRAKQYGGRVISLIGNHEFMNCTGNFFYVSQKSMNGTGGEQVRSQRFKPGVGDIANILSNRCTVVKIGSIIFCHGGLLPEHLEVANNSLSAINTLMSNFLKGNVSLFNTPVFQKLFVQDSGIIWTRNYVSLNEESLNVLTDTVLSTLNAKTIVVGHTPVQEITTRVNGKIFLIDTGFSRAFGNNQVKVLDIKPT